MKLRKRKRRLSVKKLPLFLASVLSIALSAHALTVSDGCYQIGTADDLYEFAELYIKPFAANVTFFSTTLSPAFALATSSMFNNLEKV